MYGVNRLSVRLALQKLSTLGFIETRVGEGSFVKKFSLTLVFNEISDLYVNDEKMGEIRQLRNALEGDCIRVAVQKATKENLDDLKDKLDYFYECIRKFCENIADDDLLEKVVDADYNFHYGIICLAHNSIFKDIYKMISNSIHDEIKDTLFQRASSVFESGGTCLPIPDSHFDIYQAVLDKAVEKTLKAGLEAVGEHELDVDHYVEKNFQ